MGWPLQTRKCNRAASAHTRAKPMLPGATAARPPLCAVGARLALSDTPSARLRACRSVNTTASVRMAITERHRPDAHKGGREAQSGQLAKSECARDLHRRTLAMKAMEPDDILDQTRMRTQLSAAQPHTQVLPLSAPREPRPTRATVSKRAGREQHSKRGCARTSAPMYHFRTRMPCASCTALLASAWSEALAAMANHCTKSASATSHGTFPFNQHTQCLCTTRVALVPPAPAIK